MKLRSSILPLMLLAIMASITSCARTGLIRMEASDSRTDAIVVGDRRVVDRGEAGYSHLYRVDPGMFKVAFGMASPERDPAAQGSAMILGGSTVIRDTQPIGEASLEITENNVYSSYLTGVGPRAFPSAVYRVNGGNNGVLLAELFSDIAANHGRFTYIAGYGDFAYLDGVALLEPPMNGQGLDANPGASFTDSIVMYDQDSMFAATILADQEALVGSYERIFSRDMGQDFQAAEVVQGGFAALSSMEGIDMNQLDAVVGRVTEVGVLLIDSRLRSGMIYVYEIDEIDKR